MEIRFSDTRPSGDFRPGASRRRRRGQPRQPLAPRSRLETTSCNRFEGESGGVVEHFLDSDGGRRLLGMALAMMPRWRRAELGGAAVARLLTSGETQAVIDLTGLGLDADATARWARCCAAQLALRSLPHKAQGQAETDAHQHHHRGRRTSRRDRYTSRYAAVVTTACR